jgi:integrase
VASIEKRMRNGQLRWHARYRDPGGTQLVKVFGRKLDAERFLTTVEASKLTGNCIDAKRASITFRAFAEALWAAHMHNLVADTTRPRKRSVLDRHILPSLGNYPVGAIKPSIVAAAVASWSQSLAPGTVGQVLRQVRQILDAPPLRHYFGAGLISRGVSVVAVSGRLGHSIPEITYRVYAYLKPDDELAGRAAIAETMRSIVPDGYPSCTRQGSE